jgi:tripartite-type tricarboxylate transporter receptor subunit TctC
MQVEAALQTFVRRWAAAAVATLAGTLLPGYGVAADNYPTKPVRLVAPFSGGGAADNAARAVADALSDHFGQPIIVDNRAGASGVIATQLVATAQPDGHTLLWVNSNHAINVSLRKNLPYDTVRDFIPVSLVATTAFALVIHPSLSARTVQDLVVLARSRPGAINYASLGNGSGAHFAAELFKMKAKVNLTHIPYRGVAQAMPELLAGTVPVMFPNLGNVYPHIKAGRLRGVAVTTVERSTLAPDLPTVQEAGVLGYEFSNWHGLIAPRGTRSTVIARLGEGMKRAAASRSLQNRITNDGGAVVASTPGIFQNYLDAEIRKYAEMVSQVGLKAD